jgi:mycothiol synthase
LCDLRWSLIQDVPSPEAHTEPTLAEFEEMILRDPALEAEAFFVASTGSGAFIGMSNLWRNDPSGKRLDAGMTGVVRAYRRRGIATALKVRTIQYAQTVGAETIVTSNEENNPMYILNRKLGFEPMPAWINYHRLEIA